MDRGMEEQFYRQLQDLPRPRYAFPDLVNPCIDQLNAEYNEWIDTDCRFESTTAREAHKRHRLTDIAARAFPGLTLEELRPVARFTAFLAILDDYMDDSGSHELAKVGERVSKLLSGEEAGEPEPGFYRQVYMIRQDSVRCRMPPHLYRQFVDSILTLLAGYGDEKQYNAAGRPPPFPVFELIRRQSSGGVCYAKYLCMQKDYRLLPDWVLAHPTMLRMHDLVGSIIGYHNDFISLPKELSRKGDVVNLVITVQHEFGLSLTDAWHKALEIHDARLAELVRLQGQLPDFGEWQRTAQEYVADLGVMVQGVYAWHVKSSGRYVAGAYVEPEHDKDRPSPPAYSYTGLGARRWPARIVPWLWPLAALVTLAGCLWLLGGTGCVRSRVF
ncbi:Terpene synthase [Tolypocladium capitatum]|uniref:Terpene synthase n=1 Tax=Tolypocladium capitatum TaxID=45235 RepID=A0A2K3QQY3_9HYPO|nr:Terpene synthase [Tolypocladium capitatum]